MTTVFGPSYAGAYDAVYRDKDYVGEMALLRRNLDRYANGLGQRVLDLGCGTGRHCEVLAQDGVDATGVERSPQMLELAQARVAKNSALRFLQGDVRDVRLGETFDTVTMMFAVLGYQTTNADVLAALSTARAHLKPGGAFAFDVWWGPGVLRDPPGERVRVFEDRGDRVWRAATGRLDAQGQICTVSYRVLRLRGDRVVDESTEEHVMRFFFVHELELLLSASGFELVRIGAFPDIAQDIADTTWNVSVIARAR